MELKHIDIARLSVSPVNMRGGKKAPDLTNILPSVRARGVLVPLIVRQNGSPETYEIVAGKRRYHAALAVAGETDGIASLPSAIMEAGDDAAALEASLIENIARLDPDEMTRHETFTRLVREGRSIEDISLTFGLTALQVKRTLALGNLLPRIRNLYRAEAIDAVTVRHLTLASKVQQREWLVMLDDDDRHAPTGQNLRAWLCGGAAISTKAALFDLASFGGEIVSDLFGEESYFACASDFWTAQMAAVEQRAEVYREAGWPEVVVMGRGDYFHTWEHERCPKRKGGKVYAVIGHRGVTFHEGYVTCKEARKKEKGETVAKPVRPEISAPIQNYVDLHRHAAVRASLLLQPATALRLMVAHAIVGPPLWRIDVERQRAHNDAIAESVESCASEALFDTKRRAVLALLDFDADTPTVTNGYAGDHELPGLFRQLMTLADDAVLDILAIVMGETLEAGSATVELLGALLNVDMAKVWQADDALLDLVRDREVVGYLVAEVAGKTVAAANAGESVKVQRQIVRDYLAGTGGRAKAENWVPRWTAFPPRAYTERGGVGSVERWNVVAGLTNTPAAGQAAGED